MEFMKISPLLLASCFMLSACEEASDKIQVQARGQSKQNEVVQPPPPPKITYKALAYADQSLHGVFIRHDLKGLIVKASDLELGEKKEFEKKEAFSARKAEFTSSVNQYESKPSLTFFVPDEQSVTYDADAEKFKVKLTFHSNFDGLISYNTSKKFPVAVSI